MKIKQILFYTIVTILIVINVYHYVIPYFKESNINLEKVEAKTRVNSTDLVASYLKNEEQTHMVYNGRIIEVIGKVKKLTFLNNRNTVILYGRDKDSGIICDIHPSQLKKFVSLKKNQKIAVKGVCKGFLKDVILLNCSIDNQLNE